MGNRMLKESEHRLVGIALRQQRTQGGEMIEPVESVRNRKVGCCAKIDPLDHIIAEMFVKPRPPRGAHQIAELQHRLLASPGAAAHKTEMTPMFPRHQLNNGARLAMTAGAEHDTHVGQLHGEGASQQPTTSTPSPASA